MKNIMEDFLERESLRCPNVKCRSLQTYYLKKSGKMQCRRCGKTFEVQE